MTTMPESGTRKQSQEAWAAFGGGLAREYPHERFFRQRCGRQSRRGLDRRGKGSASGCRGTNARDGAYELAVDAIFKIILKEHSFFGNIFFDNVFFRHLAQEEKSHAASTDDLADVEMREAQPTAAGDRSLTRALGLKIGKIVIDAGHGGHDTGTIGPNGLLEKDLVLDVAKRLGQTA